MALGKQGKIKKRNVLAFIFHFQKVNSIRTMTFWLSLVIRLVPIQSLFFFFLILFIFNSRLFTKHMLQL